jgi:hypothetical protein
MSERKASDYAGMSDEQITAELERLREQGHRVSAKGAELRAERERRMRETIASLSDNELAAMQAKSAYELAYDVREMVNEEIRKRKRLAAAARRRAVPKRDYRQLSNEQLAALDLKGLSAEEVSLVINELMRREQMLRRARKHAQDVRRWRRQEGVKNVTDPPPKAIERGEQ